MTYERLPGLAGLAFAVVLILAEFAWRRWRARTGYDAKAAAASIGVAVGHGISGLATAAVVGAAYGLAWQVAPVRWPVASGWTWAVAFLLVEFAYYWFHRWSHTVRWLWASHAVHHTAHELTFPAAVRLGWTSVISGGWLIFLPLVLMGFHPLVVTALLAANLKYQFLLHTEMVGRLGPLEWVLNTPSHHRVHHATNAPYLDKNFGGVLIVFDRMFGTFAAERADEPPRYGLVHAVTSANPFVIAFHEWGRMWRDLRGARSLGEAVRLTFGRPA
jgi:sterol desaturase/sphingolipid hydroxylase (fatty acid hydroxylase superfamily)